MRDNENYWDRAMRRKITRRQALKAAAMAGMGLASAGVVGCGTASNQATPTAAGAAPTAKATAGSPVVAPSAIATTAAAKVTPKGAAVVAMGSLAEQSLDPGRFSGGGLAPIYYHLNDALVQRVGKDLVPRLATSWKLSADSLSMAFELRRGVKFHNGDPFTAKDVAFAYQRIIKPEMKHQNIALFQQYIDRVEATDDFHVTFQLKKPWPVILDYVANIYPVPKDYIEKVGEETFAKMPPSLGPFKAVKNEIGQQVVLEAFEDHYQRVPLVKTLTLKVVPEEATRLAMLKAGEADIVTGLGGISIQEVRGTKDLRTIESKQTGINLLAFRLKKDEPQNVPWRNKRVRQALSYAIDRKAISEKLHYGTATPALPFPPTSFGYDSTIQPYPYDVNKAKQLLAEAGYANGFEAEIQCYQSGSVPLLPETARAVATYWEPVGVKLKVTQMEMGAFHERWSSRPADIVSWANVSAVIPDGIQMAQPYWTTDGGPYSVTSDPGLDDLVKKAAPITDSAAREEALKAIFRYMHEEQLQIPLIYTGSVHGVGPKVKDWQPLPGLLWACGFETISLK